MRIKSIECSVVTNSFVNPGVIPANASTSSAQAQESTLKRQRWLFFKQALDPLDSRVRGNDMPFEKFT